METTLLNLTRGTALKGLCGIPPVRENIIRPLINCTRQEIEDYLLSKNQSYVTDSTNLSNEYTRNKIRLEVVPKLLEVNKSLHKNYSKTIKSVTADQLFLDKLADTAVAQATCGENEYLTSKLLEQDECILTRCA